MGVVDGLPPKGIEAEADIAGARTSSARSATSFKQAHFVAQKRKRRLTPALRKMRVAGTVFASLDRGPETLYAR